MSGVCMCLVISAVGMGFDGYQPGVYVPVKALFFIVL